MSDDVSHTSEKSQDHQQRQYQGYKEPGGIELDSSQQESWQRPLSSSTPYRPSLLGDPRLRAHGNANAHIGLISRLQQTHSNRAVQRFVHSQQKLRQDQSSQHTLSDLGREHNQGNERNSVAVQRMFHPKGGAYPSGRKSDSDDDQEEKKQPTEIDHNALADFYLSEDEKKDKPQDKNIPFGFSCYSSDEEKPKFMQQGSTFGSMPPGFEDYDSGSGDERVFFEDEEEDFGGLPALDSDTERDLAAKHKEWQEELAEKEKTKQEELEKKEEERKSREEYEKYEPMSKEALGGYPESTLSDQVLASNKSYSESEGKKLSAPLVGKGERGLDRVNFKHMEKKHQPFVTAYNKSRSYHSSTKENAESVKKEGLDPMKRGGKGGAEWQQAKEHLEKQREDGKSEVTDDMVKAEVEARGKNLDRQGVFMTQHRGIAEGYPQNVAKEDKSLLRIYQTPGQTEDMVSDLEYASGMTAGSHYHDQGVGFRSSVVPPSDIAFGKFADVNKDGTEGAQNSDGTGQKGEIEEKNEGAVGSKEDHLYEIIAMHWEGGEAPDIAEIKRMHQEAIEMGYVSD